MYRKLILFLAVVPLLLVSMGCSDSCDELCNEQAAFFDGCLEEWGMTWSDIQAPADSEVTAYESAADYRAGCKADKNAVLEKNLEEGCAGEEDPEEKRKCEIQFELDIMDTCEGAKISYRYSCATYWRAFVDPGTTLPEEPPVE